MRKFNTNELEKRVAEVLFYVWDPIGVSPEPFARGEYEGYVQEVLRLVEQNDTIESISSYLVKIISDYMSLSPDKKHCDDTAKLLLEHKQAIKEGLA